ncbi:MAG: GHMP kinase [Pseudomonadota bacterium]
MSTSATTPLPETRKPGEIGARAPGKLILSGEHSVVYGRPALAVAIETYIEIWFTPLHQTGGLRTVFENLTPGSFYPFDILKGFKDGLDRRFEDFMKGGLPVQNILQRPEDLAVYALTSLIPNLPVPGSSAGGLPVPGQLTSRSSMPLGAGLGSSAAVVAATAVLYEHLLRRPQSLQDRFERVRFCERLQHGRGSAIDASAVVFGGLNRVHGDGVHQVEMAADHPFLASEAWYWVHTGTPVSKTGECVAAVRSGHGEDVALWDAFEACTVRFEAALHAGEDPRAVMTENHELLCRIGVVPELTRLFIAEVEADGGAAKVSGAGAVRGDHGGVVLVYQEDAEAMATLMQNHPGFRWERVSVARDGAALCP